MTPNPTATKPHDALAVANFFLDRGAEFGVSVDPLKLQKLVYFAHGWHLAVTGRPLFWQTVLAWPYGPVIRDVYHEFKNYGRNAIDGRATVFDSETEELVPVGTNFGPITQTVLNRVWDAYKDHSGLQMSAMAHREGTPWHQTVGHLQPAEIRDVPIPNELIRQHYLKLAKERQGVNR